MPAFLEDITPFLGSGEKNEEGLTLEEFLEKYNPEKYRSPSVTADVAIIKGMRRISSIESGLSILMIKRRNHPSIGYWALPGGFCEIGEDLDTTAKRELEEETGLKNIPMELINTWGEVNRDPRDRIITACYLAVVDNSIAKPIAGDDACDADWFDIELVKKGQARNNIDGKEIINTLYNLYLKKNSGDVECSATVSVKENVYGIIKERNLEVLTSHNIAFDHARFIVDALLYIQRANKMSLM